MSQTTVHLRGSDEIEVIRDPMTIDDGDETDGPTVLGHGRIVTGKQVAQVALDVLFLIP